MAEVRKFDTGATRDLDDQKYDYEGFLSPVVLARFAEYMHKHRKQKDGSVRDSGNWQKGILPDSYMKSLIRHVMDIWAFHRTGSTLSGEDIDDALSAVMFNSMGYLFERLREK